MLEALRQQFGDVIQSTEPAGQGIRVRITPGSLPAVCNWCKEQAYTYLHDLTAVDTGVELRLVYRLFSLASAADIVLTVAVPRAGARVPSIADIYRAADWAEREVYDLFGVRFDGHPNLRRILLDDDWEGHPLLKQTS